MPRMILNLQGTTMMQRPTHRTFVAMTLAALVALAACGGCASTDRAVTPATQPVQPQDPAAVHQHIEALIEKLAISQDEATDEPVYTPSIDTPKSDPRVQAFEAAEELTAYGKTAFPQLIAHFDDRRQSVAFRRTNRATVGLASFAIIEDEVYATPSDYRGSFYRTGADGKTHERPLFLKPALFDRSTAAAWFAAREHKSLLEIQIEALIWLIGEENRIGYPEEKDRELYLYPLQRQLERLKRQLPQPASGD